MNQSQSQPSPYDLPESMTQNSNGWIRDFIIYVSRVKLFTKQDWVVYLAWVGLMLGLLFSVSFVVIGGYLTGVDWPTYVWNVPLGTAIFVLAIAIDTIGHRTIYKNALKRGESLVHGITIFAGISSCLLLCLGYNHPVFFRIPALTMIFLSMIYSLIDEALHWHRYFHSQSDRIEMWSHFFILTGHLIMILSWWHWFEQGYPGVQQAISALPLGSPQK